MSIAIANRSGNNGHIQAGRRQSQKKEGIMSELTDVIREIDRIIKSLVDLKSSIAVTDKEIRRLRVPDEFVRRPSGRRFDLAAFLVQRVVRTV